MSLMLDIEGVCLSETEKKRLQHPFVHSLILFARNYQSPAQLKELTKQIRESAGKPILICVDQEGGRVQRFIHDFIRLPSMRALTEYVVYHQQPSAAEAVGFVMATELIQCGVDLSFAPVLDLDGISDVIGSRSFSSDPVVVCQVASAFMAGMQKAGMACVGKHFPGHGQVKADTHYASAIDPRPFAEIEALDMAVFKHFIKQDSLAGIMPAHVVYSDIDDKPAGFSNLWLKTILRQKLGFNGLIFSDDLSMQAANVAGGYCDKAEAAFNAGCDIILACNNPDGQAEILQNWSSFKTNHQSEHLQALLSQSLYQTQTASKHSSLWLEGTRVCAELES